MQVEKKQDLFTVSFYALLKAIPIGTEYFTCEDGHVAAVTTSGIITHAEGKDYEGCREDLMKDLREFSQFYIEDFADWYSHNPDLLLYVIKILSSTDEELRECLTGELLKDI